jgi:hypothetical protein
MTGQLSILLLMNWIFCWKKQSLNMRIKLTKEFNFDLLDIVDFIAKDKPIAAKKFK